MEKTDLQKELAAITDEMLYQIKECEDYYSAMIVLNVGITNYNRTICIAKDFFYIVHLSLVNALMVDFIKLFDKNNESISIKKCLEKFKALKDKNHTESSEWDDTANKLQVFEKDLATWDNTLTHLKTRRDKYYMHNDKGYFTKWPSLTTKAPFELSDIPKILPLAKSICEIIYRICSGNDWKPYLRQGSILEHERDFSGLEKLLKAAETAEQSAR